LVNSVEHTSVYVHACVSLRLGTIVPKYVATYVQTCIGKCLHSMIYVTTKHYIKFVINLHWPIWCYTTWTAKKLPLHRKI